METTFLKTLRLLSRLKGFYDLEGVHLLMESHYRNVNDYIQNNEKSVWTNLAMPNELFHAMGLHAVFTENISATLAAARKSIPPLKYAYEKVPSSGLCSYILTSIGVLHHKYLPPPAIFVIPSDICEESPKVTEYLSEKYNTDYFYIDAPFSNDQHTVDYVTGQLERLIYVLEEKTGARFEYKKLIKAIELSNEALHYFKRFIDLRVKNDPVIFGSSALLLLGLLSKFGSMDGVTISKSLYEEVKYRIEHGKSPVTNHKYRILWGHLFPYFDLNLIRYIERELGASIVLEEIIGFHKFTPLDPTKPMESIAKRLLEWPSRNTADRRVDMLVEMAELARIDGFIYSSHISCKPARGGVYFIREAFRKKGIPFIELVSDNIDSRDFSRAQLETRLEAFIDVLNERALCLN